MTELIYHEDSYMKELECSVVGVDKDNSKKIILDKTIFYPTSGGQPADKGQLVVNGKSYNVINVKKVGNDIVHEVDSSGIEEGSNVTAMIDWSYRYKLMRGHSACHVLSYVVHQETGALITGNQIKEEKCRIDFDLEEFDREQIKQFEEKTNEIIKSGIPVRTKILPREEAFEIPSVLKLKNVLPPSVEMIRIVDIQNFDAQACGGTHVKNTKEIGQIEIVKTENKGKNNRRIVFVLKD